MRHRFTFLGTASGFLLSGGVGGALDSAGKTQVIAILFVLLGAAGFGAVLGAIADACRGRQRLPVD